MVLDFFLVAAQLALQLGQGQIDRRQQVGMALAGDEVVLVLGLDDELDRFLVVLCRSTVTSIMVRRSKKCSSFSAFSRMNC